MFYHEYGMILASCSDLQVRAGILYDAEVDPDVSWEQFLNLLEMPIN